MLYYKLQLDAGVIKMDSFSSLCDLSPTKVKSNVYIVDGGPPSNTDTTLNVHVFASPSKGVFRPRQKAWSSYLYLYVPLFNLDEMEKCRALIDCFGATKETMEEWFAVAGGVSRSRLKVSSFGVLLEQWMAEIRNNILKCRVFDILHVIGQLQIDTFPYQSDSLFHWRVEKSRLKPINPLSPLKRILRKYK
jgi:hypothetical protein